jgi:hypothetical protein
LGLIEEARQLYNMPLDLPAYQVAGQSRGQIEAADAARQGIGAYVDFLNAGSSGITQGQALTQQGAELAARLDVAPEFRSAQSALSAGLGAAGQLSRYSTRAGAGLDEVRTGIGAIQGAREGLNNYLQADLGSSNQAINRAMGIMQGAGPSDFSQEQGILQGSRSIAQRAADEAAQAARLGPAPTVEAARMGAVAPVQAERVGQGIGGIQAAQSTYDPRLQTFQMGPAERIQTESFAAPGTAKAMMSPFMQEVVDIQTREALRQDAIAKQARAAQAVRAGAFGGTREGVVEAEAQRNLATQLGDIQATGLQQAYQQAQQQFNTEQQARLAAQQANQQAGLTVGQQNLSAQLGVQALGAGQIGLQTSLANLSAEQQARVQNEANRLQSQGMNQTAALQAALSNQQIDYNTGLQNAQMLQQANLANQAMQGQYGIQGAQLGLQAAAQRFQQAGFDANTAMQMAQLDQTQQQQALQQAAAIQGIGALRGQQSIQQAQLGQAGVQLAGSLGAQEAQLGGMLPAQIAQAQAGIDAQRAGLYGTLGQGLGSLAAQRAGVDLQRAGVLNQSGATIGQLGTQQAALGQAASQLGQADVSTLMSIGAMEQANTQAQLDAVRATSMQDTMAPFQQLAFVSDIYRGAPSTQSSLIASSQPAASPFQTAAGLGIAAVSAGAGAKKAGLW